MKLPPTTLPTHVPCPTCGAFSGSWCRDGHGNARFPVHRARLKVYRQWREKEKTK